MINRCRNTGLSPNRPFFSSMQSDALRKETDAFIDGQIETWEKLVPYAAHFESSQINTHYYRRHLIETIWRIRLLRVAEAKTLAEIAKVSPQAAQIWANYEMEEMVHDELFVLDLGKIGISREQVLSTEPYLSTKLLSGFFLYLLDHEGPLGVVLYSYLVEYVNVRLEPKKIKAMKISLGESNIRGQISHSHTDVNDDHPGEVWNVVRYLIKSENDISNIKRYLDEHQRILAMYFNEIYQDIVEPELSAKVA